MMNNKFKYSSTSSKDSGYCTCQLDYLFMMDYSDCHFGWELISSFFSCWYSGSGSSSKNAYSRARKIAAPSSSIKPVFILFQPLHSVFIFNFITACFITSLKWEGLKNTFCNSGTTGTWTAIRKKSGFHTRYRGNACSKNRSVVSTMRFHMLRIIFLQLFDYVWTIFMLNSPNIVIIYNNYRGPGYGSC